MAEDNWLVGLIKSLVGQPGGVGASVSVPITTTFSSPIPQRPPIVHTPSPNFRRTPGRQVSCVIIHATATAGLSSPLNWLRAAESKVSAHYLIDVTGLVYQLVHEEDVAWHAGQSLWMGRANVNDFSIGIELVNANDGIMPYPEPQLAACAQLVKAICSEKFIAKENVVGHADIAPGRKNDPLAFPWADFRQRLA